MLNRDGNIDSKVDRVFETALLELHHSLVSNYSLTLQVRIHHHKEKNNFEVEDKCRHFYEALLPRLAISLYSMSHSQYELLKIA